jgi:hypothetical protein
MVVLSDALCTPVAPHSLLQRWQYVQLQSLQQMSVLCKPDTKAIQLLPCLQDICCLMDRVVRHEIGYCCLPAALCCYGCSHDFGGAQQLAEHLLLLQCCWVPQEDWQGCMVCEGRHCRCFSCCCCCCCCFAKTGCSLLLDVARREEYLLYRNRNTAQFRDHALLF